jgi:hypothetical protein
MTFLKHCLKFKGNRKRYSKNIKEVSTMLLKLEKLWDRCIVQGHYCEGDGRKNYVS